MILNVLGKQFPPGVLRYTLRWGMETWGSWSTVTLMEQSRPLGLIMPEPNLSLPLPAWSSGSGSPSSGCTEVWQIPVSLQRLSSIGLSWKLYVGSFASGLRKLQLKKIQSRRRQHQRKLILSRGLNSHGHSGRGRLGIKGREKAGREKRRECGVWFIARPLLRDKWYLWRVKKQSLNVQIMGWDKRFYGFPSGYIKSIKHKMW